MRYGTYRYRTFSQIIPTVADFIELGNSNQLPRVLPDSGTQYGADLTTLYYMLYARYAESPIASLNEQQFVLKLFMLIYEYAPAWAKRLEVQTKLRALTDEQLMLGGKAIYNHALNPSTAPVTDSTESLKKIDSQNVTSYLKTAMEGYSNLVALLDDAITEEFLDRFERLFNPLVLPDYDLHYLTEED